MLIGISSIVYYNKLSIFCHLLCKLSLLCYFYATFILLSFKIVKKLLFCFSKLIVGRAFKTLKRRYRLVARWLNGRASDIDREIMGSMPGRGIAVFCVSGLGVHRQTEGNQSITVYSPVRSVHLVDIIKPATGQSQAVR